MGTVSLQRANQQFSKLIAAVEKGETFVITRRGRPVARIVPHVRPLNIQMRTERRLDTVR